MKKTIWLENIILFNDCVKKSGGIIDIVGSYTDNEGNTIVEVSCNKLNTEMEQKYNKERWVKK